MLPNYILVSIICLQVLILESANCQCSHGDVRLVDGRGEYMGNVQVCVNGTWGYVCDNNWGTNDAMVVCRQLGYSTTNVRSMMYGSGSGPVWLDNIDCTGTESSLLQCVSGSLIGYANCGNANSMAGAFCHEGGPACVHGGDIRLFDYYYLGRSEGLLDVCYNGQWGAVCYDGWDDVDATVACKQLGYDGAINYYDTNYYGSIKLTNVDCSSSDTSLLSCSYSTDTSYCSQAVEIRCYSTDTTPCSNESIKLWSSLDSTPDNEGIVLVCRDDGTWYPMDDDSSCTAYEIACTTAGYTQLDYGLDRAGSYFGYYYYPHYSYACSSVHQNLSQCAEKNRGNSYYGSAGVKCSMAPSMEILNCTSGDVRLVGGSSEAEGRVEYCYNDIWSPMCSLHQYTAKLICEKFGYQKWSLIVDDGRYGRSSVSSKFRYLYCSSTHTSLSQCSVVQQSCKSICKLQYGLKCFGPTNECSDGDVRLVNGAIEQEGNVEVCVDGTWGAICGYGWSVHGAYVICVSLGYEDFINPIAYSTQSTFGLVTRPIVWSNTYCQHWNKDIHHCSKTEYPDFDCASTNVAGVRCTEDCTDGDVRLSMTSEGTVQVCFKKIWGLISETGWTNTDAQVVCNQLGYTTDADMTIARVNSYYGKPNKTVHLSGVQCNGEETTISECVYTRFSLKDGRTIPDAVAGVRCAVSPSTANSTGQAALSGAVGALGGVIVVLLLIVIAIVVAVLILYRRVSLIKQNSVANTDSAMQPVNHKDTHYLPMGLPPPQQARVSNHHQYTGSKKGIAEDDVRKAAEYSELNIRTCDDETMYESLQ